MKLSEFEKAVYCRPKEDRLAENHKALTLLHDCLTALREGAPFEEGMDTGSITRMASAITALFADPGFVLTQDGFDYLAADRVVMDTLFRASVYDGTDHLFHLATEDHGLKKFLLLFSIGSKSNFDLEKVFREDPQGTVGLYLSLVSYGQVLSPESHARKERLLELAPVFQDVILPPQLFNSLCGAYMHCSYGEGEGKHLIKRVIHKMMARLLEGVEQPVFGEQVRKTRPKVLVIHEWWHSKHAMFRSYAKSIRQLKRDFYLLGMCAGKNADDESKEMFDEWVPVEADRLVLVDMAAKIKALAPDIIYYPSIGMSIWAIAMASLRLAPIQVMTYGHPATSNSPMIDYGLIESDCYVESRFSEKVITLPPNTVRPTEFQPVIQRHVPRKTDSVRIAVPAMQVKISWPFIMALQEVNRRATKKIEFWFFSAAHGVGLFSLCRELGTLLPNSTAQERQSYDEYMETLHHMDLALFSFPFGGANSCYDTMTVGLPMVSLEGEEPHSRSDASILRRAGLPEWLIAKSEAEYVETILRLLDDDERAKVANLVRAVDVEGQFYQPEESEAFVDAFSRIYRDNTIPVAESIREDFETVAQGFAALPHLEPLHFRV